MRHYPKSYNQGEQVDREDLRTSLHVSKQRWKRRARRLAEQTYALYLAYRHPRTPWYAKALAAIVVAYVFSPVDPIPDFIPVLGLLDEMVVVPIGVLVTARLIPSEVLAECRQKAQRATGGERPFSRVGVVLVIATWLLFAALAAFVALRIF